MSIAYYERLVQEDLDVGTGVTSKRNPGGGTLAATQIGIHTFGISGAATVYPWTPGQVVAGGKVSTMVPVSGAALGDFVLFSFSLDIQQLTFTADVTAPNTVEVVLSNLTGAPITIGLGDIRILVLKSR